jgi:hypothetical protein
MGVLKARVGGAWIPVSQGFDMAQVGLVVAPKTLAVGQAVVAGAGAVDLTGLTATWTADPSHTYRRD